MHRILSSLLIPALCALLGTAHAQGVPGAAASWSFNSGTGADDAGTHDATVNGAVPAADRFGQADHAFLLAGDPQHLEVPFDTLFTPGDSSFSYSLWFLADAQVPATTGALLDWYRCGANPACALGDGAMVYLALDSLGRVVHQVRDAQNNLLTTRSDSLLNLRDGDWHHVVTVLDRSADLASLYVDGQLADSVSGMLDALEADGIPIPLSFGRRFRQGWALPTQYHHGALDDIAYYRWALNEAEVEQLYLFGVGMREGGASQPLITAHPNPTDGVVQVQVNATEDLVFEVSTLTGQVVYRQTRKAGAAGVLHVDLNAQPAGTYIIRVTLSSGRTATTRVSVY